MRTHVSLLAYVQGLIFTNLMPTMLNIFLDSGFALFLVALLTFGGAQTAMAQPAQEIQQMLEQRDQEIKTILQGDTTFTATQREELKTLINGVIDFRAMGQQALGPFWSDLTPEQRTEFVEVFREIVRAQSLSDLEVYNSEVAYESIDVVGDSAYVQTATTYRGTSANVEYVLRKEDSEWYATDIVVDDVSTAQSYARSFQTLIRKRGFDALMNSLRKKRDQIIARN
jgi:phospholipid transport system substrate-binding protein